LEPSNQQVVSCQTCLHKPEGGLDEVPSKCWDCTSFKTLVHWEPKETLIGTQKLTPEAYASLHQATSTEAPKTALDTQVGGGHYKSLKIQPMEYSMANNLDACQHTAIKYLTRFRSKGGKEDLLKARHAIDLLIQFEYGDS
jgi:hypothetical protein